jgi:hypothetical protein
VVTGHRHGSRTRTLTGTLGKTEIAVPRARLNTSDGKDQGMEEPSAAELSAPHAGRRCADRGYLSGRHQHAPRAPRLVRPVRRRSRQGHRADEPVVRLILDGTVVRVRLDRKATSISLLVVIGVRAGQRMAGPPQQALRQGQLAIQNRRRPRQAEETVPSVRVTRATRQLPRARQPASEVLKMTKPRSI